MKIKTWENTCNTKSETLYKNITQINKNLKIGKGINSKEKL